ncbi:hypothetical protein [Wenxinia marina]|uniref:Uncharacterized protein n=1 Tax=Wenxinia marina DSM 24838 TaxID=1123501 RepID=A0A0D0QJS6_9RHOB|nr:hypothetical protein [Wenxinia marina]KIQ71263.1 hypothetical protein Wenmar_00031 [Wenxinia marina DSM 24838]GGL73345.1 hypothetical protein GCM10011392_29870 [Wenxinia marina]
MRTFLVLAGLLAGLIVLSMILLNLFGLDGRIATGIVAGVALVAGIVAMRRG